MTRTPVPALDLDSAAAGRGQLMSPGRLATSARGHVPVNPTFFVSPHGSFAHPFKTDYRKPQSLSAQKHGDRGLSMSVREEVSPSKRLAGGSLTARTSETMQGMSPLSTVRSSARGAAAAAADANTTMEERSDDQNSVLQFQGYFREPIAESAVETERIRTVCIKYFAADGTMQIYEPLVSNSGISGGKILRRQHVPLADGSSFIGPADLLVGNDVTIFGTKYHITDCSGYTRQYLAEVCGMPEVKPTEPLPVSTYDARQQQAKRANGLRARAEPFDDGFQRFLRDSGKKLRFYGTWDDRKRPGGYLHHLLVNYYVEDGALEMIEVSYNKFNGKYSTEPVLRRQLVPRDANVLQEHTAIATALAPRRALPKATMDQKYLGVSDLRLGCSLNVLGRAVLLYDCDENTRRYLREECRRNAAELKALLHPTIMAHDEDELDGAGAADNSVDIKPASAYPPYNGYGSEADTMHAMKKLMPGPPHKDDSKQLAYGATSLNFTARLHHPLGPAGASGADRVFAIKYHLADETVTVLEKPQNGLQGGIFFKHQRMALPGCRSFWYTPLDLQIGSFVDLNGFVFYLSGSDAATEKFVTSSERWERDAEYAEQALRTMRNWARLHPQQKVLGTLRKFGMASNQGLLEPEQLRALCVQHEMSMTDDQLHALVRRYRIAIETSPETHSVDKILVDFDALLKDVCSEGDNEEHAATNAAQEFFQKENTSRVAVKKMRDALTYKGDKIETAMRRTDGQRTGMCTVSNLVRILVNDLSVQMTEDEVRQVMTRMKILSADGNMFDYRTFMRRSDTL